MGKYYGYHRTSTVEQHLERGITEIKAYCAQNNIVLDEMFLDQRTGRNFNRPDYEILKRIIKPGDTLIITEIDRLGRNKENTMRELQWLKEHDVRLLVLELPTTLIDLSRMDNELARLMMETINNMMVELYVSMAEAEMHKKEKRQREGLEELRKSGNWDTMGRPRKMSQEQFDAQYDRVVSGETAPFKLMKELGLKKSTFYNYKKAYKPQEDYEELQQWMDDHMDYKGEE